MKYLAAILLGSCVVFLIATSRPCRAENQKPQPAAQASQAAAPAQPGAAAPAPGAAGNDKVGQSAPEPAANGASKWPAPRDAFTYAVIAVVLAGLFIAIAAIVRQLSDPATHWSLADALSEEADVTVVDNAGVPQLVNGAIVKKTVLAASSSRLIAFVGTIAILFLFVGFGVFVLWGFAKTGEVTASAKEITTYLVGGMTLFAPYVVNKFSSVFGLK